MLRELVGFASDTDHPVRTAAAAPGLVGRLLVLHHGQPRLIALARTLAEADYAIFEAVTDEDARACLDAADPPDALLTTAGRSQLLRGLVFGRECLARLPGLLVLYLTPLPWPAVPPLLRGERLLHIPFSGADLAIALEVSAGERDRA